MTSEQEPRRGESAAASVAAEDRDHDHEPADAPPAPAANAGDTPPHERAEPVEEADGREVEHDLDELVVRAEKADEYLALAQRTQADFENFRKRMARDVAAAEARGVGKLARELLPALDNLGRALAAAEAPGEAPDEHQLASGVRLVHDELLAALRRVGIEPFSPQGERFDPTEHEAMAQQPVDGAEPGTVVEVYQQGFRLGGAVLRPARVVVAE